MHVCVCRDCETPNDRSCQDERRRQARKEEKKCETCERERESERCRSGRQAASVCVCAVLEVRARNQETRTSKTDEPATMVAGVEPRLDSHCWREHVTQDRKARIQHRLLEVRGCMPLCLTDVRTHQHSLTASSSDGASHFLKRGPPASASSLP